MFSSWRTLPGHVFGVSSLSFERSGDYLLSSADDQHVRRWNVSTGAGTEFSRAPGLQKAQYQFLYRNPASIADPAVRAQLDLLAKNSVALVSVVTTYNPITDEAAALVRTIKDTPRRDGVDDIRIPSERAFRERDIRRREGILLDRAVVEALQAL